MAGNQANPDEKLGQFVFEGSKPPAPVAGVLLGVAFLVVLAIGAAFWTVPLIRGGSPREQVGNLVIVLLTNVLPLLLAGFLFFRVNHDRKPGISFFENGVRFTLDHKCEECLYEQLMGAKFVEVIPNTSAAATRIAASALLANPAGVGLGIGMMQHRWIIEVESHDHQRYVITLPNKLTYDLLEVLIPTHLHELTSLSNPSPQ